MYTGVAAPLAATADGTRNMVSKSATRRRRDVADAMIRPPVVIASEVSQDAYQRTALPRRKPSRASLLMIGDAGMPR